MALLPVRVELFYRDAGAKPPCRWCSRSGIYNFQDEEAEPSYQQAGKKITPKLLLEAIRTLPEEKRKAIMLYYFEGMTDVEIGKLFNTSRSTIQYRRTSSFEILKKYLEEHADEWDKW